MSRWSTVTGSSCLAFTVSVAPSLRASSSLASSTSTAATCRPMAFAYCTATWPRPPMPEIATHWPGRALVSLRPLYTVTPAQRIGAISVKPTCFGRIPTKLGSASTYSA
ncbi:hypothetical protein D3C78_1617990 [compost metagenome]